MIERSTCIHNGLSIHQPADLSTYRLVNRRPHNLSTRQPVKCSTCQPSKCQSVYPLTCLSVALSICRSVKLLTCLDVDLSTRQPVLTPTNHRPVNPLICQAVDKYPIFLILYLYNFKKVLFYPFITKNSQYARTTVKMQC